MNSGINYRSALNRITGFHVANSQLPQDIMHVLLEGVIPMEIKLLLFVIIKEKKLLLLQLLNERIKHFAYGSNEIKNKPVKMLEDKHIVEDSRLPFSGMNSIIVSIINFFIFSISNVALC